MLSVVCEIEKKSPCSLRERSLFQREKWISYADQEFATVPIGAADNFLPFSKEKWISYADQEFATVPIGAADNFLPFLKGEMDKLRYQEFATVPIGAADNFLPFLKGGSEHTKCASRGIFHSLLTSSYKSHAYIVTYLTIHVIIQVI